MRTLFQKAITLAAICLSVSQFAITHASAQTLLTITGNGIAEPITLDKAALESMGEQSFETTTIWTEGVQSFTGVSLVALLQSLGVSEGVLLASAINDYTVEIPVSDAVENGPIIAYERNGKDMSIRDKGPLWVVYPYDANIDYQTEVVYSRSIWQLDRIEVSE